MAKKKKKFKMKKPDVVKSQYKVKKEKDFLVILRKPPGSDEWIGWQNIPAKMVDNFDKIKVK